MKAIRLMSWRFWAFVKDIQFAKEVSVCEIEDLNGSKYLAKNSLRVQ